MGNKVWPSTISELNNKTYVHIEEWWIRPLQDGKYSYVYVDGLYLRRIWGDEFDNVIHAAAAVAYLAVSLFFSLELCLCTLMDVKSMLSGFRSPHPCLSSKDSSQYTLRPPFTEPAVHSLLRAIRSGKVRPHITPLFARHIIAFSI